MMVVYSRLDLIRAYLAACLSLVIFSPSISVGEVAGDELLPDSSYMDLMDTSAALDSSILEEAIYDSFYEEIMSTSTADDAEIVEQESELVDEYLAYGSAHFICRCGCHDRRIYNNYEQIFILYTSEEGDDQDYDLPAPSDIDQCEAYNETPCDGWAQPTEGLLSGTPHGPREEATGELVACTAHVVLDDPA